MNRLSFPGVDATITPVTAMQDEALRRKGWVDADADPSDEVSDREPVTEPVDAPDPEESTPDV